MTRGKFQMLALLLLAALVVGSTALERGGSRGVVPPGRHEVVFWHFWGGRDRPVVDEIVERFNRSQDQYFVRAIAMPGANLDLKFFLSLAGGDPPDVINQDDPIVADWAHRGALVPIDELATAGEYAGLQEWLFPAARQLASYRGRLFAMCNGLDIRALYYNQTLLDEHGLSPPETLTELDALAEAIAPAAVEGRRERFGYLPDPRRLWAWGIVFGGQFYDPDSGEVTADGEPIVRALEWMTSYSRRYGAKAVAAFRHGDQALTGAAFPLLGARRYAAIMDGQWRVRDIAEDAAAARRVGRVPDRFGVVPLPPPAFGRTNAGWVNGNFFVVPRGAKNPQGAWAFMKFWSGFGDHEAEAARACAAGGWIPASPAVVNHETFQHFLVQQPLFAEFVRLAASEHQVPTPSVPVAVFFQTEIERAAQDAMYRGRDVHAVLDEATRRVRARLEEVGDAAR